MEAIFQVAGLGAKVSVIPSVLYGVGALAALYLAWKAVKYYIEWRY